MSITLGMIDNYIREEYPDFPGLESHQDSLLIDSPSWGVRFSFYEIATMGLPDQYSERSDDSTAKVVAAHCIKKIKKFRLSSEAGASTDLISRDS